MRVFVENGLAGCGLAVERQAVGVVVDALRASANIASLFHYGTERLLVVREVAEAFAERERWPEAILVGERGGPKVSGFDLGNSPLQAPPGIDIADVIFSSSNCSRCCVAAAEAPAVFLGTTVNAQAVSQAVARACARHETDEVVLITVGSAQDEVLLTTEDHLAAGAIIAACGRQGDAAVVANDRAEVCRALFGDGDQSAVTEGFRQCENGRGLAALGLGADVEFASRLDVFGVVGEIVELVELERGGQGAMLAEVGPDTSVANSATS